MEEILKRPWRRGGGGASTKETTQQKIRGKKVVAANFLESAGEPGRAGRESPVSKCLPALNKRDYSQPSSMPPGGWGGFSQIILKAKMKRVTKWGGGG